MFWRKNVSVKQNLISYRQVSTVWMLWHDLYFRMHSMAVLRLLISCSVLTFVFLVVTFVHRPWLICGILMDPHWSITNIYHLIYYDPTSKLQNNNYHINHEHFTVCKALMFKQDYSRLKSHCWLIRLVTFTWGRALSLSIQAHLCRSVTRFDK